jgi:Glycosyl transferase family 11
MKLTFVGLKDNKLVVFTHGGGRFGNQMFSYAHLLAFALEHKNIDFINMDCWEYSDLLEVGQKDPLCTNSLGDNNYSPFRFLCFLCKIFYIKNGSLAKSLIIHLLYLFGGNPLSKYYQTQSILVEKEWKKETLLVAKRVSNLDLATSESFAMLNDAKTTFLSGWSICDWKLVEKHQKAIRLNLQINHKYTSIGNSFISEIRKKYDLLIGVMVRQGDYKTWRNGQYYFSTQEYAVVIDHMAEVFSHRGRIGFVVASDESQNLDCFNNKNVYFTTGIAGGKGHYLESLFQLSLCDAVLSPPSSFSMWATFIGEIPLIPFLQANQIIKEDQLTQNSWLDFFNVEC